MRDLTDDLYMTLLFCFRILRVIAGPISMAAPKSLPNWIFDTGNFAAVSLNLTHSYQAYSAIVEISTVSPLILFSGTWPSRPQISREVCDLTYASLIMLLIPQVRPAHKYPISPWEMIHPPGGDNAVCR
jgi:hypothetical protein